MQLSWTFLSWFRKSQNWRRRYRSWNGIDLLEG